MSTRPTFGDKARIKLWFWVGHSISIVSQYTPRGVLWRLTYRPYNWCMNRSSELDEWDWAWKVVPGANHGDVSVLNSPSPRSEDE